MTVTFLGCDSVPKRLSQGAGGVFFVVAENVSISRLGGLVMEQNGSSKICDSNFWIVTVFQNDCHSVTMAFSSPPPKRSSFQGLRLAVTASHPLTTPSLRHCNRGYSWEVVVNGTLKALC